MFCLHTDHALSDMLTSGPLSLPPFNQTLPHIHLFSLTSGSDSRVLGGGVSFGGFFSSFCGPTLGGGRWKSLDWSCWALGQGRVPLTHSTGSSQTAFWPWTWKKVREHLIKINSVLVHVLYLREQCSPWCHLWPPPAGMVWLSGSTGRWTTAGTPQRKPDTTRRSRVLTETERSCWANALCQSRSHSVTAMFLTYEKVWSAVLLQESVEMVPKLWHPVK